MVKKISTGIHGLDSVLFGGYLAEKPTILKGQPGTGKTIYSLLFTKQCLLDGYHVTFVTCDEAPDDLENNLHEFCQESIDWDKLSFLDCRMNIDEETIGEYELTPILLRIQTNLQASNNVVIIDSLHSLLQMVTTSDHYATLQRLIEWHKNHNITLLMTMGADASTSPSKIEEYYTDCVIELSQRVNNNYLMTRYLQVKKMRRSAHGTNLYPFTLNSQGVSLLPITSVLLTRTNEVKHQSTGITSLDEMLGGGYLKYTSVLISGETGTAKTLLASTMAAAASSTKEPALYISFEQSNKNLIAGTKSIGLDLQTYTDDGRMLLEPISVHEMGLEDHLIRIISLCETHKPSVIVLDSITTLLDLGNTNDLKSVLSRFSDFLKNKQITSIYTELIHDSPTRIPISISSLIDTFIRLRQIEKKGELYRLIHVVKSRGSKTSNQVREFLISDNGLNIDKPYIGYDEILFGRQKIRKTKALRQKHQQLTAKLKDIDHALSVIHECEVNDANPQTIKTEQAKIELIDLKHTTQNELTWVSSLLNINKELNNG